MEGNEYYGKGDYLTAIKFYNNILDNYKPFWYNPIYNKGLCFENLRKYPEAIAEFEKIPPHDPNYTNAINEMRNIYKTQNDA